MPLYIIAIVAVSALLQMMVSLVTTDDGRIASMQADVQMIGQSMLALHTFAATYAQNNPAYTGTPTNATLGAPAWYVRPSYLSVYVTGGKSYVYYNGSVQGLPNYLVSVTQDPYSAGTDQSGMLSSPTAPAAATAALTIPAAVPNGSVVVMP
jgi:PilM